MDHPSSIVNIAANRFDPAQPPHGDWRVADMLRDNRIRIDTPAAANDEDPQDLFPALRAAAMFARRNEDDGERPALETVAIEATD